MSNESRVINVTSPDLMVIQSKNETINQELETTRTEIERYSDAYKAKAEVIAIHTWRQQDCSLYETRSWDQSKETTLGWRRKDPRRTQSRIIEWNGPAHFWYYEKKFSHSYDPDCEQSKTEVLVYEKELGQFKAIYYWPDCSYGAYEIKFYVQNQYNPTKIEELAQLNKDLIQQKQSLDDANAHLIKLTSSKNHTTTLYTELREALTQQQKEYEALDLEKRVNDTQAIEATINQTMFDSQAHVLHQQHADGVYHTQRKTWQYAVVFREVIQHNTTDSTLFQQNFMQINDHLHQPIHPIHDMPWQPSSYAISFVNVSHAAEHITPLTPSFRLMPTQPDPLLKNMGHGAARGFTEVISYALESKQVPHYVALCVQELLYGGIYFSMRYQTYLNEKEPAEKALPHAAMDVLSMECMHLASKFTHHFAKIAERHRWEKTSKAIRMLGFFADTLAPFAYQVTEQGLVKPVGDIVTSTLTQKFVKDVGKSLVDMSMGK